MQRKRVFLELRRQVRETELVPAVQKMQAVQRKRCEPPVLRPSSGRQAEYPRQDSRAGESQKEKSRQVMQVVIGRNGPLVESHSPRQ